MNIFDFDLCVNAERDCNWWCWQDCEILGLWAHKGWGLWEEQVSYYLRSQTQLSHSDFSIPLSLLGFNVLLLCVIHRRLMVKHIRTLQLDEDVLCVRYSPDQRLLAVSLLDCTVKIFYTDTLKVNHKHSIALQYFPHTTTHSIMLNPYINPMLCVKKKNIYILTVSNKSPLFYSNYIYWEIFFHQQTSWHYMQTGPVYIE